MLGRFNLGGGSAKVNGIIEEYMVASNGNINAGDFVKYVSEVYGERQSVIFNVGASINYPKVLQISDDKVFLLYHKRNSSLKYDMYGCICTITKTSIIAGTEVLLHSASNVTTTHDYDCTYLGDKILIGYVNGITGGTYALYQINQTELTFLTSKSTSSTPTYLGHDIALIKVSNNCALSLHGGNSSSSSSSSYQGILYSTFITINDNTLELGEMHTEDITNNSAINKQIINLNENKFGVFYSNGNGVIKFVALTVSNDSFTSTTTTTLRSASSSNTGKYINVINLNENTYLLLYSYYSSNYKTYYMLLRINDNTVSVLTQEKLWDSNILPDHLQACILKDNKFMILWTDETNKQLHKSVYNFDSENMTITLEENTVIDSTGDLESSQYCKAIFLNDKNLFFVGSNNTQNWILFAKYDNKDLHRVSVLENANDKIFGVAKTKGVGEQMVKIYVPEVKNDVGGGVALLNKLKEFATLVSNFMRGVIPC